MAYNADLAARLREAVGKRAGLTEKEMFGGLALLLHGSMFVGILGEDLMVRVGPDAHDACLKRPHARPMDFTGRPMTGYLFIGPGATATVASIRAWAERCIAFVSTLPRKKPKSSAKKRKK